MATTEVSICNLALSRLGETASLSSIDPPEGSAEAEHCAIFYPIARDTLLELHDWKFATRRVLLAAMSDADTWEWAYAYATPAGLVRALKVLPASASAANDGEPFDQQLAESGDRMILTNCAEASLLYTVQCSDTSLFPPLFVDALVWLLAADLAGPIIKGNEGATMAKTCMNWFTGVLAQAKASDANQRLLRPDHTPGWIAGR